MRSPAWLSVLLAGSVVVSPALAQPTVQEGRVRRPPPLAPQPSCELWRGMASGGNDPSVQVELLICPAAGGRVTGRTQWSSLLSGYNVRVTEGTRSSDGARLVLRDARIVEEHPEPGWRFCTIDRYDLRRVSAVRLEGAYDSAACQDHAALALDRIGPAAAPPPAPPTHPAPAPPPPPSSRGGGFCTAAPAARSTAPALVAPICALALVLAARRRLSRRRRAW